MTMAAEGATPPPLGLAIVGCGGAGADVAAAIARVPALRLVATHDRDEALARDLAAPAGATVHGSIPALLDDDRVEAVYVALPHDLLAPAAREVLLARRHALVEKPMATSRGDIDALATLAAEAGRTLGVFYEMRFSPAAIAARDLVQDGAIGGVQGVHIRTLIDKAPGYWRLGLAGRSRSAWRGERARAGGGVVLMNSSHQLDIVFMVTGLEILDVAAQTRTRTEGIDVEDAAAAVLRFSNGALGTLVAGAHVAGADGETIELLGEGGRLLLDPYAGSLVHTARGAAPRIVVPARGDTTGGETFVDALTAFALAARSAVRPPVGAPEARAVLATIEALYASAAASGAPVEVQNRGEALTRQGAES